MTLSFAPFGCSGPVRSQDQIVQGSICHPLKAANWAPRPNCLSPICQRPNFSLSLGPNLPPRKSGIPGPKAKFTTERKVANWAPSLGPYLQQQQKIGSSAIGFRGLICRSPMCQGPICLEPMMKTEMTMMTKKTMYDYIQRLSPASCPARRAGSTVQTCDW